MLTLPLKSKLVMIVYTQMTVFVVLWEFTTCAFHSGGVKMLGWILD